MKPSSPHTPRRRFFRKAGGVLAILVGSLLIVLERSEALGGREQGVAWFWMIVGVLLIALGLAELLDRSAVGFDVDERQERDRDGRTDRDGGGHSDG